MIFTKWLLLMGLLFSFGPSATQPLRITATVRQQEFGSGSQVRIWLNVANASEEEVSYIDLARQCDYSVEVRKKTSGLLLPLREGLTEQCRKEGPGRQIRVVIPPGDAVRDGISLNEMVDLSEPGDYSVRVSRLLPGRYSEPAVSNIVEFRITR